METTEIVVRLVFEGEKQLTKSQIWEAIDELIQNETIEIDSNEYNISVGLIKNV